MLCAVLQPAESHPSPPGQAACLQPGGGVECGEGYLLMLLPSPPPLTCTSSLSLCVPAQAGHLGRHQKTEGTAQHRFNSQP